VIAVAATPVVAAYDALLVELDDKARNAAHRNKPTMWAYYEELGKVIAGWFEGYGRTDDEYAEAALALSGHASAVAPKLPPADAARAWAAGIYARRIARAGGWRCAQPSLAWLRERVA
jgi:hypothetical protein